MTARATQPTRPPDQSAGKKSKHIWAMLILAPLVWVGLWWVARWVAPELVDRRIPSGGSLESVRHWINVVADISLMGWVLVHLRQKRRNLVDIGFKTDWMGREAIIGLLTGLLLWIGAIAPLWLVGLKDPHPMDSLLETLGTPIRFIQVGVIALTEETVWRGFVITELHRFYRLSASVVVAVATFAVFHLGEALLFNWLTLPLMLYLGGGLSLLYLWRRSLMAPIVAHAVIIGLGLS